MSPKYVVKIGVMGYSKQGFDQVEAKGCLLEALAKIEAAYPGAEFKLVAGYNNLGVAAIAYAEAQARGWKTVGIASEKVYNYDLFPCDEVTVIGEKWGDESPKFVQTCHVFIRIGGGNQTHREAAMVRMIGKPIYEYDLPTSG